jgi:hypothetical protein
VSGYVCGCVAVGSFPRLVVWSHRSLLGGVLRLCRFYRQPLAVSLTESADGLNIYCRTGRHSVLSFGDVYMCETSPLSLSLSSNPNPSTLYCGACVVARGTMVCEVERQTIIVRVEPLQQSYSSEEVRVCRRCIVLLVSSCGVAMWLSQVVLCISLFACCLAHSPTYTHKQANTPSHTHAHIPPHTFTHTHVWNTCLHSIVGAAGHRRVEQDL